MWSRYAPSAGTKIGILPPPTGHNIARRFGDFRRAGKTTTGFAKGKLKTGRKKRAKGESETFEYRSAGAAPRPFTLLTIAEAAIKFERTPRQIRYLCLRGRIPYVVGRPPLVDEIDLAEYFESKRLAALAKIPPAPGTPEFNALQDRKATERMRHRLRMDIRREIARHQADDFVVVILLISNRCIANPLEAELLSFSLIVLGSFTDEVVELGVFAPVARKGRMHDKVC